MRSEVKGLFQRLEGLSQAINKEASSTLISAARSISAKNLGGIEVPDAARLVLKFLDRRLEVVVNPLQSVGGRPVPIGGLASASVIQYDASDPTGADWFDVTLKEDGWHRKVGENDGRARRAVRQGAAQADRVAGDLSALPAAPLQPRTTARCSRSGYASEGVAMPTARSGR